MLSGLFMIFGYAVRVHVFLMLAYWLVFEVHEGLWSPSGGRGEMAMATVARLHVYDVYQMLSLSLVLSLSLAGCLLMVRHVLCSPAAGASFQLSPHTSPTLRFAGLQLCTALQSSHCHHRFTSLRAVGTALLPAVGYALASRVLGSLPWLFFFFHGFLGSDPVFF